MSGSPAAQTTRGYLALATISALLFGLILIRTAWLSDDALITLRTVLNATHGFGLTFNIAERVQTFTHPLWMLLITGVYSVIGNIYYATLGLAMGLSLIVFWSVVRSAASPVQAWLAAGVLLFSRAFVDFSTSGLENPLSNLLLALTLALFLNDRLPRGRWLTGLWLLTSLLYLTRPDDVLLVLPCVALACWDVRQIRAVLGSTVIGLLPAILWTMFSLVYYGLPFPNTAYAKLATGIPNGELWRQGFLYLIDSIDRDPLTPATIAIGLVLAAMTRHRAARALMCGVVLYLVYVARIGGDFMAGRFMVAPFFCAVLMITRLASTTRVVWAPVSIVLAAAALVTPHVTLFADSRYDATDIKANGTVDERAVYFKDHSIVRADRRTFSEPDWPHFDGRKREPYVLSMCGLLGGAGLDWGPYTHLLDECALADPLLARLPSVWNPGWRPGHFRRLVPAGYEESLASNTNKLGDAELASYYEHVRRITRADSVWSVDRLREILRFNRGKYDSLINRPFYRYSGEMVELDAVREPKADETPWSAPGVHDIITELAVTCEDKPGHRRIDVSLDSDDSYRLYFLKQGVTISTLDLGPVPQHRRKPGLSRYVEDVPDRASRQGFDTIVVLPINITEHAAMGHLRLDPQ